MRLRKTLAYGDGDATAPMRLKMLAYSFMLTLPLLSSCAAHAGPAAGNMHRQGRALETQGRPASRCAGTAHKATPGMDDERARSCRMKGRTLEYLSGGRVVRMANLLETDERLSGIACRGERTYVLTDRSLIIVRPQASAPHVSMDGLDISFAGAYSRTDMRDILAPGLVTWTQSDDAVFFLTRNGTLTLIPSESIGATVPSYSIPYGVEGARMHHHGGYLFLATRSGDMVVLRGAETRTLAFRTSVRNPEFFVCDGALMFGKRGVEENEIRIGERIESITLERR